MRDCLIGAGLVALAIAALVADARNADLVRQAAENYAAEHFPGAVVDSCFTGDGGWRCTVVGDELVALVCQDTSRGWMCRVTTDD